MLKLNVLTPERKAVVDLEVTQVTVPAFSGEMTILPGHAPLVTTLGTGIIKYKVGADKVYKALISSGYCEVTPAGVNVLAEFMQLPEEVNVDTEQAHLQVAEKKLVTEVLDDVSYEETRTEVAKAQGAINLVKLH
ncbi:MAG: ATP synthase F1 subunit epsilon [Bdellovibrionaceae bacterium]|nr:ATP synthase F1 subunit epsilon [Pseudobdellovibrionaceae bacterium]